MTNILDPKFKYTPADRSDIRQTFKRVKREIRETKERVLQEGISAMKNVRRFPK